MSILSSLFGGNKKRDTTYQGPQAPASLMSVTGGPEYYKNITGRLAGQGVGFGDEYANQASNPVIKRMRNEFSSYQIPELMSELSSQGRRKGSGGFDQIRRAYQEQGLNEGDVYSGLYQQNEAQKRNEINDALGRLGQFNQNEYNTASNYANDQYGKYRDNLAEGQRQRAEGNAATQNLISTVSGVGQSLLPYSSAITSRLMPSAGQSLLSQNYAPQNPSKIYPGVNSMSSALNQRLRIK